MQLDELDGPTMTREERANRAADRPEDSFVWWAEATRGTRRPKTDALDSRVRDLFLRFRRYRLSHSLSWVGRMEEVPHFGRVVRAARGKSGPMLYGPYIPMPSGQWEATFELHAPDATHHSSDEPVAFLEVTHGDPLVKLGGLAVAATDLSPASVWSRHTLRFALDTTVMGVEFRVLSSGRADLFARASVDLRPEATPILSPRHSKRGAAKQWLSRHLER
jgi:hypothetical protein